MSNDGNEQRKGEPMSNATTEVFFREAYNDTGIEFDTTRKADWVAKSLVQQPIDGVTIVAPSAEHHAATERWLERVHDAEYLEALVTGTPSELAESNGIGWDERLLGAVTASTAGVYAAVLSALASGGATGSLSSGLHHARFEKGRGYCTVNGVALGALVAAEELDGARVLVLDLDAHGGGGTASLLDRHDRAGSIRQVDVAVSTFDGDYPIGPERVRRIVRARPDEAHDTYLDAVREVLAAEADNEYGLVLYNAGMDPHEGAGGMKGITTATLVERERIVFEWAAERGLPIAFTLAGGYLYGVSKPELVDLHRVTITEAAALNAARNPEGN